MVCRLGVVRLVLSAVKSLVASCLFLIVAAVFAADGPVPDGVNIAKARERRQPQLFSWVAWTDGAFAQAKRERKFILLDCAAEWCHWCHVMDETTYLDPEIGRILSNRFVAIRVDIDARPDLAERYGDWGWPATIIFSPDAEEIGKFRGYLAPDELKGALADIESSNPLVVNRLRDEPKNATPVATDPPAPTDALGWVGVRVTRDMDEWYDPDEGGWGRRQKAPIGANIEFELRRMAHGDVVARQRAVFSLEKQQALMDPVWGGVSQYSASTNWDEPHFEKLMAVQAANLEAYARGYQETSNEAFLADAKKIDNYLEAFLTSTNGTFFATQDADLNAHEKDKPFVDGHTYYALNDAGRRKLGIPRIDTHVYARENGLAIAALCTLYEVTHDEAVLKRARRAADAILVSHITDDGSVWHDADRKTGPFYLADAAAFGFGLARLGLVSGDPHYRLEARRIALATVKNFEDETSGGYFEHTPDANAAGVFTHRQYPFVHNVVCARFFATLSMGEAIWRDRSRRILAAIATPRTLDDQGRMVGEYLLALDEAGAYSW
jgi:uncharacterized protein YyaL (SSP411 family)